jgi:Ni,Fe-hydrogenase III small subunit
MKSEKKLMPENTRMVPRVFKTNVGDIYTTNLIDVEEPEVGMILSPRAADGILVEGSDDMQWQVVKVYTMPDGQPGVKLMRIA